MVSYRVRIRIKNHCLVSKTFKNLFNARKWKRIVEAAIEKEEYLGILDKKREILSDAIEKYSHEIVPNKPKSAAAIKRHLKRWSKELGDRMFSKIKPSDIAAVRDKLLKEKTDRKKDRNPATVVRYLASLSHLFSIAFKEWEWAEKNPRWERIE